MHTTPSARHSRSRVSNQTEGYRRHQELLQHVTVLSVCLSSLFTRGRNERNNCLHWSDRDDNQPTSLFGHVRDLAYPGTESTVLCIATRAPRESSCTTPTPLLWSCQTSGQSRYGWVVRTTAVTLRRTQTVTRTHAWRALCMWAPNDRCLCHE